MSEVRFADVEASEEIKTYIMQADQSLAEMGFTEHSFAHVGKCAAEASRILVSLGFDEKTAELARIAGYMHDIGNIVNRADHAQSGAIMAFRILDKMGMPPADVATVIMAIGNHDETTAHPVNAVAAALILADKTDVRRSRVRSSVRSLGTAGFDIHDRVNYAVVKSAVTVDTDKMTVTLALETDTEMCSVTDYFQIFLNRMLLCRKSAAFLKLRFILKINGTELL